MHTKKQQLAPEKEPGMSPELATLSLHRGQTPPRAAPAAGKEHRMTLSTITVSDVLSWIPSADYPRHRLQSLIGRGKTPAEICDLAIPVEDRLWMLLHPEVLPARTLYHLACQWAENALPYWEAVFPFDRRPHRLIDARRRWIDGQATDAELDTATADARAATRRAARSMAHRQTLGADAAWAAAETAAWLTAGPATAAEATGRTASWTAYVTAGTRAIRDAQLDDVRQRLSAEGALEIAA